MDSNSLSLPSSSSTSSTNRWKYDVFLSFRGEDTRYKFTDHLYKALVQKGIFTFKDDEKLKRGKSISLELLQAIEESRFAIVILSENYATSSWCLDELVKIIECEKELGMTVFPIFHYVDPSDVRKQLRVFKEAFVKHEKRFEKKKVETWRDALSHVGNLAGCHLKNISPETQEIQSIVRHISCTDRYKFFELNQGLVGIYPQAMELESLLALDQVDDVRFIGVWAMGGMGKTTLARFVYDKVLEEFDDSCFLSDVREVCEKHRLPTVQKTLILKLLKETHLDYDDDHDLSNKIKTRFRNKKILLVLDDVNQLKQLRELAGEHNWFGLGSRIIITTRCKDLLQTHSLTKSEIYEVKPLKEEDARHLFYLKSFKKEHIPNEFLELSNKFLNYVDGLPLALEVLGSFLFGKSIVEWKSALERLKEGPGRIVIQVLEISFDGLDDLLKEIFLHIACLFNHEEKDYVVEILHSLDLYPEIGLRELIDKSLLKISDNNELWMHNLLREMGRNIVRQESPDEPGKRSRLWLYEDIDHVLKNNTGTEAVQAIDIRGAQKIGFCPEEKEECWRPQGSALLDRLQGWVLSALSWRGLALLVTLRGWVERTLSWRGFKSSKKQKGPLWNPNAFLKMPNLKFLRVQNIYLERVPKHLPINLRFIEWSDYPSKLLPCFQLDKLVQLHLQRSKIEILWKGMKIFDKLKFINLADSSNLIISPDFTGVPNLKKLVLAGCSNLRKLHPSIGNMKKLIQLDLEECKELICLPDKLEMESLEFLKLSYCSKVKKVPEFVGDMKRLQKLLLECTAITELPSSVKCLTGLNILILRGCKNLKRLPNTICSLKNVRILNLSGCSKIVNLPKDLGKMKSLSSLRLQGTAIKKLPFSIIFLKRLDTMCFHGIAIKKLPFSTVFLRRLNTVSFRGCQWPSSPFDLMGMLLRFCIRVSDLDLSDCHLLAIPDNIGCLYSLVMLRLSGNDFVSLPESISHLFNLRWLYLDGCKRLQSVPDLPSKVERTSVNDCTSLERLSGPENNIYRPDNFSLCFSCINCFKLADNIQSGYNMLQGQSGKLLARRLPSLIPGSEIPSWLKEVKICEEPYSSFVTSLSFQRYQSHYANVNRIFKTKKVNIQVPFNGCDEWKGILLSLVIVPRERHRYPSEIHVYSLEVDGRLKILLPPKYSFGERDCKFESHHLWLVYLPHRPPPKSPCASIDAKGFHQVEIKIAAVGMEVEKIGFGLVYSNRSEEERISPQYLLL